MPDVSIIIPHYNQPEALLRCLASLAEQDFAGSSEILVIDNGSHTRPDPAMLEPFGAILLHEGEPGPGPARNLGARTARGELLLFIDADCRAHAHWITAAVEGLSAAASTGVVGGDVQIDFSDVQRPSAMEAYEAVFAFRQQLYIEQHGYSGTGNLAVRRDVFEKVGPFVGVAFAEDAEWGRRAAVHGHPATFRPDMIVYHPARRGFAELKTKWQRHIDHGFAGARSKKLGPLRWVFLAHVVLGSTPLHAVQLLFSDRVHGAGAKIGGIGILCRIRLFRYATMLRQLLGKPATRKSDWDR